MRPRIHLASAGTRHSLGSFGETVSSWGQSSTEASPAPSGSAPAQPAAAPPAPANNPAPPTSASDISQEYGYSGAEATRLFYEDYEQFLQYARDWFASRAVISSYADYNPIGQEVALVIATEGLPENITAESYLKRFAYADPDWNRKDYEAALAVVKAAMKNCEQARTMSDRDVFSYIDVGSLYKRPPDIQQDEDGEEPILEERRRFADFMFASPGSTVELENGIIIQLPESPHFDANRTFYYYLLSQPWLRHGEAQSMLPSGEVIEALANVSAEDLNLDYYGVTVRLPEGITPEQIFDAIARQPDVFSRGANFTRRDNTNRPTRSGDIFDIRMGMIGYDIYAPMDLADHTPLEGHGSVLVVDRGTIGKSQGEFIIVQTITSNRHSTHPVDGARAFGYTVNQDGEVTIWTMGADAQSAKAIPLFHARYQQEAQWYGFSGDTAQYVVGLGGEWVRAESWRNYNEYTELPFPILPIWISPSNTAVGMVLTPDYQGNYSLPSLPADLPSPTGLPDSDD